MSRDSFQAPPQGIPAMMSPVDNKYHDQEIHTIHIPKSIRKAGIPTNDIIADAISFLHHDGIIILENAIETSTWIPSTQFSPKKHSR